MLQPLQEILNLFDRDEIPWDNLVSDLSVSANYMFGKKSGLETNSNGDLSHHIHNSVKQFCSSFNNFVDKLLDDLHTDNTKYSLDIRH